MEPVTDLGRTHAAWMEAGVQFRSNLLAGEGAFVPLHAHSYDHVMMVIFGWVQITETLPSGEVKVYQMASRAYTPARADIEFAPVGWKLTMPAWHKHHIELLESVPDEPADVLCLWANEDEVPEPGHEGC